MYTGGGVVVEFQGVFCIFASFYFCMVYRVKDFCKSSGFKVYQGRRLLRSYMIFKVQERFQNMNGICRI